MALSHDPFNKPELAHSAINRWQVNRPTKVNQVTITQVTNTQDTHIMAGHQIAKNIWTESQVAKHGYEI